MGFREASTRSWVHHGPHGGPGATSAPTTVSGNNALGSTLLYSLGKSSRRDSFAKSGHRSSEVLVRYYARAKDRNGIRLEEHRVTLSLFTLKTDCGGRSPILDFHTCSSRARNGLVKNHHFAHLRQNVPRTPSRAVQNHHFRQNRAGVTPSEHGRRRNNGEERGGYIGD